jgi:putative hydrolase of the HAD superfamily
MDSGPRGGAWRSLTIEVVPDQTTPTGAPGDQQTTAAADLPPAPDADPLLAPDADPQPAPADADPQPAPADADPQPAPADADPQPAPGARPQIRGVIIDWGGVMTNPILDTVDAWIRTEQIDRDSYTAVMRAWVTQAYGDGADNPIHALERGECTNEEFELRLADRLTHADGRPVPADGLLARMFAATALETAMLDLVRSLREAGLRTALLSNSWGNGDYPRHLFPELFDVVVISSEVGMRKPEERIFRHTASLLGLEPTECVFIDDVQANVAAAEAIGLVARHHREPELTIAWLTDLLGPALGA